MEFIIPMSRQRLSLISVAALLLAALSTHGTQPRDWENQHLLQINRLPARAHFIPHASAEDALAGDSSSRSLSLDGDWKFHWVPRPDLRPQDFHKPDFDTGEWESIPVPANWELHGYGTPIYVSAGYPFKIDPPRVTSEPPERYTAYEERNPVGSYRRDIVLPDDWSGQRTFLHFGGVMSAFYVWINGERVGYSQGSNIPSEFEVTDFIRPGTNTIAVEVYRWSDGSYLEDQDMWRLSGIHRSVYLYTTPEVRISDFTVRTELDDACRDARLLIKPELDAPGEVDIEGWRIKAQLYGPDGKEVLPAALEADAVPILNSGYNASVLVDRTPQRGPRKFSWMEADIKAPHLWTAETPNLYRLVLSLHDANGKLIEAVSSNVGFREVEIRDGQFLVNGQPVRLRGVNRHEHDPATGHALTKERMLEDVLLMKRANVNAVRTAHYSNDPYWYELCDRYGLYVMDEADIETHGLRGYLASQPDWHAAFLDRAVRMAERDKNFPSVVFWSMGNESGFGPNFAAISAWLREFDPTRPIHYEGAQGMSMPFTGVAGEAAGDPQAKVEQPAVPDPAAVDVISRFYPRVMEEYLNPGIPEDADYERAENARWERLLLHARSDHDDRPVLTSEYGHCMGNALGNLQEYWDEIYSHPRMLGGFIWDWVDQGLYKVSPEGERYIAYGGDFGDYPNLKAFCLNGIIFADRSLTPKFFELQKVYQPVAVRAVNLTPGSVALEVINRHHHVDLSHLKASWELSLDGEVLQTGSLASLEIPPGESARVLLPVETIQEPVPGGEYWLMLNFSLKENTLWAEKGHIEAWEQFKLEVPGTEAVVPTEVTDLPDLRLEEDGDHIRLSAPGFSAAFSRTRGKLVSLSYDGEEVLAGPEFSPVTEAYRAYTDNDRGFGNWLVKDWHEAGLHELKREMRGFSLKRVSPSSIEIVTTDRSSGITGWVDTRTRWSVFGDGRIRVDSEFVPGGELPPLPRVGLVMALDKRFEQFRWYGHGPHENYPDRKESAPVGVWNSTVTDQYVPYPRPQDTGNKEGVRWLTLSDGSGQGILVSSVGAPFSASALHYSTVDLDAANHTYELDPRPEVFLSLKARESGLGNSSCGPGVLERYAVPVQPYAFSFVIQPVADPAEAPALSRQSSSLKAIQ